MSYIKAWFIIVRPFAVGINSLVENAWQMHSKPINGISVNFKRIFTVNSVIEGTKISFFVGSRGSKFGYGPRL